MCAQNGMRKVKNFTRTVLMSFLETTPYNKILINLEYLSLQEISNSVLTKSRCHSVNTAKPQFDISHTDLTHS